jgi:hypothetical protein
LLQIINMAGQELEMVNIRGLGNPQEVSSDSPTDVNGADKTSPMAMQGRQRTEGGDSKRKKREIETREVWQFTTLA